MADGTGRALLADRLTALAVAWADPAAWEGSSGEGLELPNATWGRIVLTEAVVHAWDLAVALGRPLTLSESTLRACLEHVVEFVPAAPLPELWGDGPRAAGDGAPLLDRIVAGTGRTPLRG